MWALSCKSWIKRIIVMKVIEKLKGWTFDYHSGKNLFAVIHKSVAVYDGKDYHVLFKSKGIK